MNKNEFFAANWGAAKIHSQKYPLSHIEMLEYWWNEYLTWKIENGSND